MEQKTLVYYFAFPHYRKEILEELKAQAGESIVIASGVASRAAIKSLSQQDFASLLQLDSIRLAQLSWQKGIFTRAVSSEFETVVLGPATLSLTTWAILIVRTLLRKKTYLWGQGGLQGERSAKRFVHEAMNRLATGLLVYGELDRVAALEMGMEGSKVHIVRNANRSNQAFLDPTSGANAFARLRRWAREVENNNALTIVHVGRLLHNKKPEVLLNAARLLHERFENFKLIMVGGGPDLDSLKERYPDPFIDFRGWVYDADEIDNLIREATLVVSPYGMGLLAIDALRAGTPVLIPDNPRNGPETGALTENVNALRFKPGDSIALVDAVESWLRLSTSISEQDFSVARESALRNWSPESVAFNILKVVRGGS